MQYRKMPKSEDQLSVLGYGCMRFPTKVGGVASNVIDKELALSQIRGAIDRGVNYLDTAYPYHLGASESFLGEYVLKDGYREKIFLATKLPCMIINRAEQMQEIFDKQLKKLQTDYIDYYLLHALDGVTWEKMKALGVMAFMDELKKGQVRHMGFSFHGKKEDFMKICDEYPFDFVQVQYNILDEHYQAGIEGIDYAHSLGMGVIVMEGLRGGTLVGDLPKSVKEVYDQSTFQRTPADWAMRWIYNNPKVTVVLSGMNREEHITENIRVASESIKESMSQEELQVVEDVKKAYRKLLQVDCTGCAYCMPCPAKIDIPAAFKNLNNAHMFSRVGAKLSHARFLGIQTKDGQPHFTDSCIDCGKCEEKCPQNILIRETFKQVADELEGPGVKVLSKIGRFFQKKNGSKH